MCLDSACLYDWMIFCNKRPKNVSMKYMHVHVAVYTLAVEFKNTGKVPALKSTGNDVEWFHFLNCLSHAEFLNYFVAFHFY